MKEGVISLADSENQVSEFDQDLQNYTQQEEVATHAINTDNEDSQSEFSWIETVLWEGVIVEKQSIFSKLFWKKKRVENTSRTEGEEIVKNEVNTNIFEDFTSNATLKEDVKKLEKDKNKDSSYYISLTSSILKIFNTIFLVIILVLVSYVYIQKKEEALDFSFLNPICSFIIGDIPYEKYGNCEGVRVMKKLYAQDIAKAKEEQYTSISLIIWDIYTRENFLFSREITFLLDRSRNRVTPLKVLAQFDKRKNQFEWIEKSRIQCKDISISEESILTMMCDAYSADWEKGFIGFDANKSNKTLEGTSITAANSFLNFLEMNAPEFALINRQKKFGIENVTSEWYYTKKTSFKLELRFDRSSL